MSEAARDCHVEEGGSRKPTKAAQGRPPKSMGKRKGQGQKVDMDTYYHMMHAYDERQTIGYVAKVCGVSEATARKYVQRGDPSRSLPSLHDHWTSSQGMALKEEGLTLAKARTDNLRLVTEMIGKYEQAISKLDPSDIRPHAIAVGLDRLIKMQEHLLQPVEGQTSPEDRYADWTDEELEKFMYTGVIPERHRVNVPMPKK